MLVGNYEEIREVKAIKPASAVMFTVGLVFSYLSLAERRVFCPTHENKASSGVHCRCRPQIYFCKESVITSSGLSTRLICLGTEPQKNPTLMPQQES